MHPLYKESVVIYLYINEYFSYDGVDSRSLGIMAVRMDDSLLEFTFGTNQNILEDKVGKNIYYYGNEYTPLQFEVTITLDEHTLWNTQKRMEVVRWLFKQKYCPLIFEDNQDIVYYCQPIGDLKRFDTGMQQGYATLTFRCDSHHANLIPTIAEKNMTDYVTPTLVTDTISSMSVTRNSPVINPLQLYNYTGASGSVVQANTFTTWGNSSPVVIQDYYNDNTKVITSDGTTSFKYVNVYTPKPHDFTLENKSNIEKYVYPEIQIEFLENTSIILTNLSDGGKQFTFNNIPQNTVLDIDNGKHSIISSDNKFYLDNFNKQWFRLVYGINQIKINNEFKGKISFKIHTPVAL